MSKTIAKVAELGRKAGAPMLGHVDTEAETRQYFRDRGATTTEIPMVIEAAQAARDDRPVQDSQPVL